MAFMHHTNPKQVIGLIVVSTVLLCATIITNNKTDSSKANDLAEPSAAVKELDGKLLTDLRSQEIEIDEKTKCIMECTNVSETELKSLFAIENVNYEKCEKGNCHLTSYTIEGKTNDGKQLSFKLDSGEDGNSLRELNVNDINCGCI
ncbi:MAG: hypothetical protein H7Y00_15595 [Fimbriimonadaceae bacterium]|nr:hypothetical protein [Chitinophagales bacterium]